MGDESETDFEKAGSPVVLKYTRLASRFRNKKKRYEKKVVAIS